MHRARRVRSQVGAAMLLVAALVAACGDATTDTTAAPQGPPDTSAPPADEPVELGEQEAAELAAALNDFGFELHRTLADGGGNTVISPLSVAMLLAVLAAGAEGATAEQMADVLGLEQVRDPGLAALLAQVTDTDDVEVTVANALWADEGLDLERDYTRWVLDVFDATLAEAPLGEQATAEEIDDWVRQRTGGLIDGIAEELGLPDPAVVLVALNAVYFLGEWSEAFDPAATRELDFTLAGGDVVAVPTMHRPVDAERPVELAQLDGYQLLRLPYGEQGRYAMEVYLPEEGRDVGELLDQLDEAERAAALARLEPEAAEVLLPRVELEWSDSLVPALRTLGMELPFEDGDFTAMSPTNPALDRVVHSTYLRVDEQGTEAAAVTGGAMTTSLPPGFRVDRPFVVAVSDSSTGALLFLGSVLDPRG